MRHEIICAIRPGKGRVNEGARCATWLLMAESQSTMNGTNDGIACGRTAVISSLQPRPWPCHREITLGRLFIAEDVCAKRSRGASERLRGQSPFYVPEFGDIRRQGSLSMTRALTISSLCKSFNIVMHFTCTGIAYVRDSVVRLSNG